MQDSQVQDKRKKDSRKRVEAAFELCEEPERIKSYYDDWAQSYNSDVEAESYIAPAFIAALVAEYLDNTEFSNLRCLDAGCGTGLVGWELKERGFTQLTGTDISADMVKIAAQSGAYTKTQAPVDLNHPLAAQIGEDNFDITVCCGVFTLGHVPPEALDQLYDITSPSGLIAISARSEYVKETGFEAFIENFAAIKSAALLHCATAPYVGADTALYVVIKKAA